MRAVDAASRQAHLELCERARQAEVEAFVEYFDLVAALGKLLPQDGERDRLRDAAVLLRLLGLH